LTLQTEFAARWCFWFYAKNSSTEQVYTPLVNYRALDLTSNPTDNSYFENNFIPTKNCPVTRTNLDEPNTERTNWCHHCSDCDVRYSTV